MKKLISLLLFVITVFSAMAQEQQDTIVKKKRVHFKIFYAPNYSYRKSHSEIVGIDVIRPQSSDILAYHSNQETPIYGYEFGVLAQRKLPNNFFLSLGLSFEKMGYQTKQIDTVYGLGRNGGPYVYYQIWDNMSVKYKYFFLSLPIMIGYKMKPNKITYNFSVGVGLDYLLNLSST